MTDGLRTFTIPSSALAACPEHLLLPSHYRTDGSCLHTLKDREPVMFRAGFLDDDIREAYSGQPAVIVDVLPPSFDAPDYLIEFESGNRLSVYRNEVTPRE